MEANFGSYYTDDEIGGRTLPDNSDLLAGYNIFRHGSQAASDLGESFRTRLAAGETLYLLGFLGTTHNSGLALIEASRSRGIVVIANHEEEKFAEVKHFIGYPGRSVREMKQLLSDKGISPSRIFGVFYAYDTVLEEQSGMRMLLSNSKIIRNKYYKFVTESLPDVAIEPVAMKEPAPKNLFSHSPAAAHVFRRLVADLGLRADICCVQMLHHENHAYYAYGASPFAGAEHRQNATMISCIDGGGDVSSISLFQAKDGVVELIKRNHRVDSLGVYYMICSCLLGGWTALSAEGRYMGAAAWGNGDRLTNPYYARLREFFHLAENGEVFYNSSLAENDFAGLERIVGPFVELEKIWAPDAVLNVDDVQHSPVTQERVDKAAAVQMVFEDALFHIVAHLIKRTSSDQLILCGGTALNCVANMRLMEHFDRAYYRRYFGRDTELKIWAPPIPSDQGVVVGAAYQFAMINGAEPTATLPSPFLCGRAPTTSEISKALQDAAFVEVEPLGNVDEPSGRRDVADWMAYAVANHAVVGIYQGEGETGPRALGHRSILSNPCNPGTLEILNSRVKLRERIRPLAPMVTPEEAGKWFELRDGAAANSFDAYNYMVLTARAKPEAHAAIPAVIHFDGTSRIQIVRKDNNELIWEYLRALKRYIGVEVSVNTSLNVGTPIVQTPEQAVRVFQRSKGIDAIIFVGDDGVTQMAWARPGVQARNSDIPRLRQLYRQAADRPRDTASIRELLLNAQATPESSIRAGFAMEQQQS